MPYIGRPLNAGNLAVQSGTGDGSDTTPIATLDYSVGSSNSIGVYLDGVRQLAGTDFTASGTVLTFTTAPANLVGIDVYFLGLELSIPTPADATVAKAKITTTLINEHVDTVITAADSILFADATDSNANKKDTVQGILDLAGPLIAPSSVHLHTTNGYGGTNNKIRRWTTTITNTGSDITYADSASLGGTFTINTDGLYAISYSDEFNAISWVGISLNSSQLTTIVTNITAADVMALGYTSGAALPDLVAITLSLVATDVIRCHSHGLPTGTNNAHTRFAITRVG